MLRPPLLSWKRAWLAVLALLCLASVGSGEVVVEIKVRIVPVVPSVPTLASASDSGESSSDGVTTITSPTVTGTTSAGALVTILSAGIPVGSAVADGSGAYAVVVGPLNVGVHNLNAVASYDIGYAEPSPPRTIQIVPPGLPSVGFTTTGLRVEESIGSAAIAVQLSAPTDFTVLAPFTVSGSAGSGDFTAAPGPLAIAPGAGGISSSWTILDDGVPEPTDTVIVNLATPTRAILGTITQSTLKIDDDDTAPAITVSPGGNLLVSEAGTSTTFQVSLMRAPTGTISVPIDNGNPLSIQLSVSALTFTPANFDTPQSIVVTGLNDGLSNGNTTISVGIGPVATGTNYAGVSGPTVTVINQDIQSAGLLVTSPATLTENGPARTYTVALSTPPSGNVTISVIPDSQLNASPTSLVFTTATWATPQLVSISANDDIIAQGSRTVYVAHQASGGGYSGVSAPLVAVGILDDDTAGVLATPSAGLTTTKAGGQASFSVRLNSMPRAGVTISLTSSDTAQGTVSPSSLSFTAGTWNTPRTVTLTGVNDGVPTTDVPFRVSLTATSTDAAYSALTIPDVQAVNLGTAVRGVVVVAGNGTAVATVTEDGAGDTLLVRLGTPPTANVTVTLTPDSQLSLSTSTLLFTPGDWAIAQPVTVSAPRDDIARAALHTVIISVATSGGDYTGLTSPDLQVQISEADSAGIAIAPASGLAVSESGGVSLAGVRLTSRPLADVTLGFTSSRPGLLGVSPATLTFTNANWNQVQNLAMTGIPDQIATGDQPFVVTCSSAVSGDGFYHGLGASPITGIVLDVDTADLIINPTSVSISGVGTSAIARVRLASKPVGTVTVAVVNGNTSLATASPSALTFTPSDWQTTQDVTISGFGTSLTDAVFAVTLAPSGSDPTYASLPVSLITVNRLADGTPIVVIRPPVVTTNLLLQIAPNATGSLMGLLSAQDDPANVPVTSATTLRYRLDRLPTAGLLRLGGVQLTTGDLFTQADLDAGLVTYTHGGAQVVGDAFNFVVLNDVGGISSGTIFSIDIDRAAPEVAMLPTSTATWVEGTTAIPIANLSTIIDLNSTTFDGGNLLVNVTTGAQSGDLLAITNQGTAGGQIGWSGNTVTYGGVVIGTFGGGVNGSPLLVGFNADSSPLAAQALLRAITYSSSSGNPTNVSANRIVTVTVTDDTALTSAVQSRLIIITPLDDAPVVQPVRIAAIPGIASTSQIQAVDPEGLALSYTLTGLPFNGNVVVNPTTGAYTYTPDLGYSGSDTFTILVSDAVRTTPVVATILVNGPTTPRSAWIWSEPPYETAVGDMVSYVVRASGPPGATWRFSLISGPTGATLIPDANTGTALLQWTAAAGTGDHAVFSIMVWDDTTLSADLQQTTIFVSPTPLGGG